MNRARAILLSVLPFWALSAAGHAEGAKRPADGVTWSVAPVEKAAPKKKSSVQRTSTASPGDADKAARIEEGRKKFFEQSSGFDNSTRWNTPTAGGSAAPNGGGADFKPGMGFNF